MCSNCAKGYLFPMKRRWRRDCSLMKAAVRSGAMAVT
jgi:hypothetical protein